jgi:1-deoxy-D-xylulose-5-phosphate reductoisomerase
LILLGSTGSIGVNTLIVAQKNNINIEVLVAGYNIKLLNQQIKQNKPSLVIIASKNDIHKVNHSNVLIGEDAILNTIKNSKSNLIVNALVGFLGLKPTITAIQYGKRVALANKESLVVAGKFIDIKHITPIDSEHFGLWYLMDATKPIHSLTITASGGSFRDYPIDKLKDVTIKEALNHPNWAMGNKITIDSATMTNKLFELIEARWFFGTFKCDAIIESKSIIHAMVNYKDGSTTAYLAKANMQLPISYAILSNIKHRILEPIDLIQLNNLEFKDINKDRYAIWEVKNELLENDNLGVVLNASNEIGVDKFLNLKIPFLDIAKLSLSAINKFNNIKINTIDDIFEIDTEVRSYCNG